MFGIIMGEFPLPVAPFKGMSNESRMSDISPYVGFSTFAQKLYDLILPTILPSGNQGIC